MNGEKLKKKYLKEGDNVCHVSNMKVVMSIDRIVYESREILVSKSTTNAILKQDGYYYIRKSFLQGIICKYIDSSFGKPEIIREQFHSNSLIPHEIVLKGDKAINDFLYMLSKGHNTFFKKEK